MSSPQGSGTFRGVGDEAHQLGVVGDGERDIVAAGFTPATSNGPQLNIGWPTWRQRSTPPASIECRRPIRLPACSRLAGQAEPAQVLVGETARAHANTNGVRFEDLGAMPIKGVARPIHVYRALRDPT